MFSSCVLDLQQFIFTSVDIDIRSRFIADFVCSVYYDSFAKTVAGLRPEAAVFSLGDFIREFNDKILHGFVAAAELHTWMVRDAEKKCPDTHSRCHVYISYLIPNATPDLE